jgi:hypothetical protein
MQDGTEAMRYLLMQCNLRRTECTWGVPDTSESLHIIHEVRNLLPHVQ